MIALRFRIVFYICVLTPLNWIISTLIITGWRILLAMDFNLLFLGVHTERHLWFMIVHTFQTTSCLITSKVNSPAFDNRFETTDSHKLAEMAGTKVHTTISCSYATNRFFPKVSRRTNLRKLCRNGFLLKMSQDFIPRIITNRLSQLLPWFLWRHPLQINEIEAAESVSNERSCT